MYFKFVLISNIENIDRCNLIIFKIHEELMSTLYLKAGSLGGAVVWRLPLAQGAILETRDQVPHQLPAWSLLLPLPVSLPLSLSL